MSKHLKHRMEPRRLAGGRYVDRCDCGRLIVGATPDEVLGATCVCNGGHTVRHLAELACFLCGRQIASVLFPDAQARVLIPSRLRCERCGGPPVVADVSTVMVYPSTM
jgi:hypothetical protein